MDKTKKELRARLRKILLRWLQSDAILYYDMKDEDEAHALEASGLKVPESALGRKIAALAGTDHNGIARVFLTRLADDDEIGLLVSQIGERRPLKRIVDGESETWVVCRPGLSTPSLPQEIRSMDILMDMMTEAIVPEWIEHLDKEDDPMVADTGTIRRELRLKHRRQNLAILRAISELSASPGTVANKDPLRDKLEELGEPIPGNDEFTSSVTRLKDRGLIDSKTGARGGYWLTDAGKKFLAENNPKIPLILIDPA